MTVTTILEDVSNLIICTLFCVLISCRNLEGSTTVYPYNNKSLPELELGASIFVPANKNLWRATEEFNLTKRDFQSEDYQTGIWDGESLLVAVRALLYVLGMNGSLTAFFFLQFTGGWWDTAKLLWRYGFSSPRRTDSL